MLGLSVHTVYLHTCANTLLRSFATFTIQEMIVFVFICHYHKIIHTFKRSVRLYVYDFNTLSFSFRLAIFKSIHSVWCFVSRYEYRKGATFARQNRHLIVGERRLVLTSLWFLTFNVVTSTVGYTYIHTYIHIWLVDIPNH